MRDSIRALLDEEAGLVPQDTWQYMDTCPTLWLNAGCISENAQLLNFFLLISIVNLIS
jgi:hypothetical protein